MKRLWGRKLFTFIPRDSAFIGKANFLFSGFRVFMVSCVLGFSRKQAKIFRSIVVSYMIKMMNYFSFYKIPSKLLFHNKTRTLHISPFITKRVIGFIEKNISLMSKFSFKERVFSSFLKRGFIGFHKTFTSLIPSLTAFFKSPKLISHIIIILVFLLSVNPFLLCSQWQEGTGEDSLKGAEDASDIDTASFENVVDPLDRLLDDYREGCRVAYASAATITVGAGEIVLENVAGTIKLFQENTSATTVAWTDIDTGAEAASTTYYLYAFQETVTDTDFDVCISTSSSAPTGKTYYKRLGSFYNDASSNITNDNRITNDNEPFLLMLGDWVSKTVGTSYQASTDGFVTGYISDSNTVVYVYTDSSNPPTTVRSKNVTGNWQAAGAGCVVKKGDYYKMAGATSMYWIPSE